jgi:hypothetical protein
VRLQEEIGAQAGEKDHRKAISERLKQIKDLLRFSRFRPAKDGVSTIDPESMTFGGESLFRGGRAEGTKESGKKGGRARDLYALFAESGAVGADPVDHMGARNPLGQPRGRHKKSSRP